MNAEIVQTLTTAFEAHAQQTEGGIEYWLARDIQPLLGYDEWRNFTTVIIKAKAACEVSGHSVRDHFVDVNKTIQMPKSAQKEIPDIMLTRNACYFVAQNGDPRKQEIAFAQTYFADARTELFRSSWSIYDTVIAANYMFHREIESAVDRVLGGSTVGCSLLDLGCGNAHGLATLLRAAPPRLYVGVDVSRPALDQAAVKLAGLPEVRLQEEDMLACVNRLAGEGARFDWVHSAFAGHHLNTADKGRLFQGVARLLAPGGGFLLVDVVRGEGQSREAYLEAYLNTVDEHWLELSREQRREVREHIAGFDFPETWMTLSGLAQAAGFQDAQLLGTYREHQVMLFHKSP